jgi:hypothetical protein
MKPCQVQNKLKANRIFAEHPCRRMGPGEQIQVNGNDYFRSMRVSVERLIDGPIAAKPDKAESI